MIQVDVWSGDLHHQHAGTREFSEWEDASTFMAEMVEAGMLCNVLHTDFKAPAERVSEAEAALAATLSKEG